MVEERELRISRNGVTPRSVPLQVKVKPGGRTRPLGTEGKVNWLVSRSSVVPCVKGNLLFQRRGTLGRNARGGVLSGKTRSPLLLLRTCFTATIWLSRCSPRRSPTPACSAGERKRLPHAVPASTARPTAARSENPRTDLCSWDTGRTVLGLHREVAVEGAAERHGGWGCKLCSRVALSHRCPARSVLRRR